MTATSTPAERIIGLLASHVCARPELVRTLETDGSVLLFTAEAKDQGRIIGTKGQTIRALSHVAQALGLDELRLLEPVQPEQLTGEGYTRVEPLLVVKDVVELIHEKTGRRWAPQGKIEADTADLVIECDVLPDPQEQAAYTALFRAIFRKEYATRNPDFEFFIEWVK